MNNKVMARIVAAALAVMMLGTLAFADATYTNGTITSTVDSAYEAQTIYTLLAYKADSADDASFDDADIIAIEQSTSIADIKSIVINPAKVADAAFIKVLYGGKEGVTDSAAIALTTVEDIEQITISLANHGTYEFNGQKISNVIKVEFTVPGKEGSTITKVGVEFQGTAAEGFTTADGTVIEAGAKTGSKIEKTMEVAGGASVTFTAYLFGVPAADAATMTAYPFVQYN